jgi:GntR family transcriptional repressor for pyruvate dehydrogenase complex
VHWGVGLLSGVDPRPMSHIRKSTLVGDVANELREAILAGEIPPGEFLPTRKELAARFGVGLSTVHEAIQVLAAVGLVKSRPGKGTWVQDDALEILIHPTAVKARLGDLNIQTLYESRAVIEVAVTELAAGRATPKDIQRIWDALKAMEETVGDPAAFVEADLEFHLAVAHASHNDLLEQFYHLSRGLLADVITELVEFPNVKEDSIANQRAIAQAIERRDVQSARRAGLEHLSLVGRLIQNLSDTQW